MRDAEKVAREILRRRYENRGFQVQRVRRTGEHFSVIFGELGDGRGAGPSGLRSVICNWPEEAHLQNEFKFTKKLARKPR